MHLKSNTIQLILIVILLADFASALPKGGGGGGGGGRGGGSSGGSRSGSGSGSGGSRSGGSGSGGSGSSGGGSKSGGGSSGGWSSSPSTPSRGGGGGSPWSTLPHRSSGPTGRRTVPIPFFGGPSMHIPHPSKPGVVGWYDYSDDDNNTKDCNFRSHDGIIVDRVPCPHVPEPPPISNAGPAWTPTTNVAPAWTPTPSPSPRMIASSSLAVGAKGGCVVPAVVLSMAAYVLM